MDDITKARMTKLGRAAGPQIKSMGDGGFTIDGREGIALYRLLTIKSGLGLELKGLRMTRGVSCYAIAKREFGLKGNKQKVYEQLCAILEVAQQARQG